MRNGKLDRSIALPPGRIGCVHYPDGLDEAAVDDLMEEAHGQVNASPRRPGWLSSDVTEQRRARRRVRQLVRVLPGSLGAAAVADDPDGEAA